MQTAKQAVGALLWPKNIWQFDISFMIHDSWARLLDTVPFKHRQRKRSFEAWKLKNLPVIILSEVERFQSEGDRKNEALALQTVASWTNLFKFDAFKNKRLYMIL